MGMYHLCPLVYYHGDDPVPMNHRKKINVLVVVVVVSMMLIVPIQPAKAQFILAGWDYPAEYGQGIEEIRVYENISGEWKSLTPFGMLPGGSTVFDINSTATGIQILVKCWLNNTVVGAVDFEDGKNYLRHNVTLTLNGETIFSQNNFTYSGGTDAQDPIFFYIYYVDMPFSPIGGLTYIAVVYYEIYY